MHMTRLADRVLCIRDTLCLFVCSHSRGALTMGPKMITHAYLFFGNQSPNCTGHLLHRAFRHEFFSVPSQPKLLQKIFVKKCFGTIKKRKFTKQSLYKANSFACSLANRNKPVAATLQRKCSGGIIFVIITKIITKINSSKELFCNTFGQYGNLVPSYGAFCERANDTHYLSWN